MLLLVVREKGEASTRCRRPPNVVDQNIDTGEALADTADDLLHPFGCAEVRFHEQLRLAQAMGSRSRRGDHLCARTPETFDDGFAYTSRATRHECAFANELGFDGSGHLCTSTAPLSAAERRGERRAEPGSAPARGYPFLFGCRDHAHEIATRGASGPRLEHHSLALDRQETEPRPNAWRVRHE